MNMQTVLSVFWHSGRRKYVPWTRSEIINRTGGTEADVTNALVRLCHVDLVEVVSVSANSIKTYHLTPSGEVAAGRIRTAEAVANGGAA